MSGPRAVRLTGEALRLATEMEAERARVNGLIQRELEMHRARVTAIHENFTNTVKTILDQLCLLTGMERSENVGVDSRYLRDTGVAILVDVSPEDEEGDDEDEGPTAQTLTVIPTDMH